MGNWLPYVTGGYAQGSFSFYAASLPPSGTNTEAADATQHGAYIGGGVEVALIGSAILGVEYRHYGFNTKDVFILTAEGTPETVRFDTKTDVVMARLSWKFGDWGTPYYPAVVK